MVHDDATKMRSKLPQSFRMVSIVLLLGSLAHHLRPCISFPLLIPRAAIRPRCHHGGRRRAEARRLVVAPSPVGCGSPSARGMGFPSSGQRPTGRQTGSLVGKKATQKEEVEDAPTTTTRTLPLKDTVTELCNKRGTSRDLDEAIELIKRAAASIDRAQGENHETISVWELQPSLTIVLDALSAAAAVHQRAGDNDEETKVLTQIDHLLQYMKQPKRLTTTTTAAAAATYGRDAWQPERDAYAAAMRAWSQAWSPHIQRMAGEKCDQWLTEVWTVYNKTTTTTTTTQTQRQPAGTFRGEGASNEAYSTLVSSAPWVPTRSMYISTLTALARSGGGITAAQRIDELLDEMERCSSEHPHLRPTTTCMNIALYVEKTIRNDDVCVLCVGCHGMTDREWSVCVCVRFSA